MQIEPVGQLPYSCYVGAGTSTIFYSMYTGIEMDSLCRGFTVSKYYRSSKLVWHGTAAHVRPQNKTKLCARTAGVYPTGDRYYFSSNFAHPQMTTKETLPSSSLATLLMYSSSVFEMKWCSVWYEVLVHGTRGAE